MLLGPRNWPLQISSRIQSGMTCCSGVYSPHIVWDDCHSRAADDRLRHLPAFLHMPQLDYRSFIARSWQRGAVSHGSLYVLLSQWIGNVHIGSRSV
jgi:hypothetical protein